MRRTTTGRWCRTKPDHSYLVGQRVAQNTPSFGRLIGDITSCEFSNGHWRILVDWIPRTEPGLAKYAERRRGIRLAYLIDPQSKPGEPETPEHGDAADAEGPTVARLLEKDLEDHLRESTLFVSWAGLWAPLELLPATSGEALDAACREQLSMTGSPRPIR